MQLFKIIPYIIITLTISGCAGNCVEDYTEYLARSTCSDTITKECKKQSVVNAAKTSEAAFYIATKEYKAAYDKDAVTSEIASKYVTTKNAFCEFVNSIEE